LCTSPLGVANKGATSFSSQENTPQWFFAGAILSIVNIFVLSCTYGNVGISPTLKRAGTVKLARKDFGKKRECWGN
jgi:hypothetical protein